MSVLVTALLVVNLLSTSKLAAAAVCNDTDYTISIEGNPYFRVARNDRSCSCETFVGTVVGQVYSARNASSLQAQIDRLNASLTALSSVTPGSNLGSSCSNDSQCVYPFVCSPTSLRCLGSAGVGCTLDTQCAYGLRCQAGVCIVAPGACPTLSVANGFVTYTNNGAVGSIATVSCVNGFVPVATASPQTCQSNGQWSGSTATCMNYNPCATDPNVCAPGHCTSTTGAYTCVCPSGWTGSGTQRCTLHNSLTFNWPSGFVGGATAHPGYNNANLVGCIQSPSNIMWKACIQMASQYGGMLEPVAQTSFAWKSHREMAPTLAAQYIATGNDPAYRSSALTATRQCLVCRDSRATQNNMTLTGFTTYDGQDWHYQDFGFLYYDECQLLASNAGAMMISPATIGIASSLQYHVNVVWVATNAYFPSIGGNNDYIYETKTLGSRSTVRGCMVGFVDT